MITSELARPPQAQISGSAERIDDYLKFTVSVTNHSNVSLSSANRATVHVLVYEERRVGLTGRFVHQALSQAITTPLAPNAQASFTLQSQPLANVHWDALRFVALVDYLPAGSTAAYEQLQATFLPLARLASQPESVTLFIDSRAPHDTTMALTIIAPYGEQWSAAENTSWFSVSPATGVSGDTLLISIQAAALSNAWQEGYITLTTTGMTPRSITIPVRVYLGEIARIYIPFVHKTP